MKLKTITIIRAIFLCFIIATVLLETVMDSHCILNNQGHKTLYIVDIICYSSILYTEILQIELIS
jgi:hypothetical protein